MSTKSLLSTLVVALTVLLAAGAALAQLTDPIDTEYEGYDIMRQITIQQLPPNMMIVLDQSGSLSASVDMDGGSPDGWGSYSGVYHSFWHYSYGFGGTHTLAMSWNDCAHISGDFEESLTGSGAGDCGSYPVEPTGGAGQGYWLRAANGQYFDSAQRVFAAKTESVSGTYTLKVSCSPTDPGWATNDIIELTGNASYRGIYKIGTVGLCTSSFRALTVYRRTGINTFSGTAQTWGSSALSGLSLQRGTITSGSYWYFVLPSRLAILKNALARHLTIHYPLAAAGTPTTDTYGKPMYTFDMDGGPVNGAYYDRVGGRWENWDPTTAEPVGDDDYTEHVTPRDFIGSNQKKVNWGLVTYNGSCGNATVRVSVNPASNATQTESIEALLDTIDNGGLKPNSSTPTTSGLQEVLDAGAGLPYTFTNDAMKTCGRVSTVLLITDGVSNNCNPNSAEWGSYCNNPYNYPDWTLYPAGAANTLWDYNRNAAASPPVLRKIRTWVIGVSDSVGRCELNRIAYVGRTDATSPNGDAGYDTAADPFLNPDTGAETTSIFANYCISGCTSGGVPYPEKRDYAFFANNTAELEDAFKAIMSGFGAGDYTTAAPAVSASAVGNVGLLASADFPGWRGHLYAYDLTADCSDSVHWDCTANTPCGWTDGTKKNNCIWDAGQVLSTNRGLERKLYTWNPSTGNMVEMTSANLTTIQTIAGCGSPPVADCGFTANVLDFARGGIGAATGVVGRWRLGPLVNSTPAVVAAPKNWVQSLKSHTAFQAAYSSRHQLVWVGSSDGFLHAFDLSDGAEIVGVMPPTMLARQSQLYENFLGNPQGFETGQPKSTEDHIYGMANSPRFGDVWTGSSTTGEYKTVLFSVEGPGADTEGQYDYNDATTNYGVYALDVTHPWFRDVNNNFVIDVDADGNYIEGADPNYGFGTTCGAASHCDPVRLIWDNFASEADFTDLGKTWSVPALGASNTTEWQLYLGAGFDADLTTAISPKAFRLNAATGARSAMSTLTSVNTNALVHNQSFADAVTWGRNSAAFAEDNLIDQGVQADLHGQVWVFNSTGWTASALFQVGAEQPIYYPPAVASYPYKSPPDYSLYAFASGSFYEKSDTVSGPDVGTTGHFVPKLYIGKFTIASASASYQPIAVKDLSRPAPLTGTIGRRAQVSAPPMIFVPRKSGDAFALFLVYDPDPLTGECVGRSYIIRVNFNPADLSTATTLVYSAGKGAAAGFAIAGDQVVVSKSWVASSGDPEGRANIQPVPDLTIPVRSAADSITWWRELQ